VVDLHPRSRGQRPRARRRQSVVRAPTERRRTSICRSTTTRSSARPKRSAALRAIGSRMQQWRAEVAQRIVANQASLR
jgi:hypothetical protein